MPVLNDPPPIPDFFILHAPADQEWAEWIGFQLELDQHHVILAAWDFVPGENRVLRTEQALKANRVIVLVSQVFLEGLYSQPEWTAAYANRAQRPLIPVRVQPCEIPDLLKPLVVIDLVGCDSEEARRRLVLASGGERNKPVAVSFPGRPVPNFPGCPFPGLDCFQLEEAPFFFGRERNVAQCLAAARGRRWLQVEGPSGVGKSSFVRAGLLPKLQGPGASFVLMEPADRPLRNLATALSQAWNLPLSDLASRLESGNASALSLLLRERMPPDHDLLLIIDQFEEAIVLSSDARERARFDALLEDVLGDSGVHVRLITSIRSDFLARFPQLPKLQTRLNDACRFYLEPLDRKQLTDAVREPAKAVGLVWSDDGLPDRIVNDALDAEISTGGESAQSAGTVLPLVGFVLRALWEEQRRRDDRRMTLDDYNRLGGVAGALRQGASTLLASLDRTDYERARRMLLRMVRIGHESVETRVPCTREQALGAAGGGPDAERMLLLLSGGWSPAVHHAVQTDSSPPVRLIAIRDQFRISLVHEELLRQWPEMRRWIDQDRKLLQLREEVETAARQWVESGRGRDWLPKGGLLERYQGLGLSPVERERFLASVGKDEREFVDAAVDAANREAAALNEQRQRQLKRNRRLALIFAVLAAAATISAVFAVIGRGAAIKQKELAQRNESRMLAGQAQLLMRSGDYLRAAQAALASAPQRLDHPERPITSETASVLTELLRTDPHVRTFRSPLGEIKEFLIRGDKVIAGVDAGVVEVFDRNTGREKTVLTGGANEKISLAAASDDELVLNVQAPSDASEGQQSAPAGDDPFSMLVGLHSWSRWRVVSMKTWTTVAEHPAHGQWSALFLPDGLRIFEPATEKKSEILKVRDGHSGTVLFNIGTFGEPLHQVLATPGKNPLVMASTCSVLRFFSPSSPQLLLTLGKPALETGFQQEHYMCTHYSFDAAGGQLALAGEGGGEVEIHDMPSGKLSRTLKLGNTLLPESLADAILSPQGRHLIALKGNGASGIAPDGSADVFDLSQPKNVPSDSLERGTAVENALFESESRVLITKSDRLVIMPLESMWSLEDSGLGNENSSSSNKAAFRLSGLSFDSAQFLPDHQLATLSQGVLRIWRAELQQPPSYRSTMQWFAEYDPSGKWIVSGGTDRVATLWDAGTGKKLRVFPHKSQLMCGAFSPDGQLLATGSTDGMVKIWNPLNGSLIRTLPAIGQKVNMVAFSPDSRQLATVSRDPTLRVYDAASGNLVRELTRHRKEVWSVAYSPTDHDLIATASEDGSVIIWHADGSTVTLTYGTPLVGLAFSPDGKTIVAGGMDGVAPSWNVASGKRERNYPGHSRLVLSLAFNPVEGWLASADEGQTVRLWLPELDSPIAISDFQDKVRWVRFRPDGKRLVAASFSGEVRQIDVPPRGLDLVRLAREHSDDGREEMLAGSVADESNFHAAAVGNAEALQTLKDNAAKGNADDAAALGWLSLYGRGVPKDITAAAKWFERARSAGSPEGWAGLAWMAEQGIGRPANQEEALSLYHQATQARADQQHQVR